MSTRWALEYRPKTFSEIIGQKHVVRFFETVLGKFYSGDGELPVGCLFGGHSGVGKTTLARVIAASLNCVSRVGIEPCGKCESCENIVSGSGGVYEVDASFFGLVDNIRQLRDKLDSFTFQKYQVVILDECHMMSREANNVLLKLFEEPPEKVFFILCTTETHKILDTVRSRLLEFRFTIIQSSEVVKHAQKILEKEKVTCNPGLIEKLYVLSNYNVRDIIVALEQLSLLGKKEITSEHIAEVYGDVDIFDKIVDALYAGEYVEAVELYDNYELFRSDFKFLLDGLILTVSQRLQTALKHGGYGSKWYAVGLKKIYEFLSSKLLVLKGRSAACLLFHELLPDAVHDQVSPRVEPKPKSRELAGQELFAELTSKLS